MTDPPQEPSSSLPNIKTPTLGGKQVWTDHCWRQGWRIQQNALTGHWRLLDENNVRHAWGTRSACEQALDRLQPDRTIPQGHLVFFVHGLMRSASSMQGLRSHVADQLPWPCASFEYASTRGAVSDHAKALRDVVRQLPADVKLSFVGHSMGNVIVRHAIGDWRRAGDEQTLKRLTQVVMLGPPNQGASIARQLGKLRVFGWVAGKGALELGPEWRELEEKLATPPCPFGIIAGRLPETSLQNPLVDGEGDFVVSLDETKLAGAADFLETPRLHTFLMDDPAVRQAVVAFLKHQRFR